MTAQDNSGTPYDVHHWELHKAITQVHEFDFRLAYDLDKQLKASKDLQERFAQDPKGVAMELVGLELPPNFHIHYINDSNEYIPRNADPIADPLAQIRAGEGGKIWGRVEIRTAVGPGAIAVSIGIPDVEDGANVVAMSATPSTSAGLGVPDPADMKPTNPPPPHG